MTVDSKTTYKNKNKRSGGAIPRGWYGVAFLLMGAVAVAFLAMLAMMNILPGNMTAAVLIFMLLFLALAWVLMRKKTRGPRVTGLVIALVFLLVFGTGTYYLGSTYAAFTKMSSAGGSRSSVTGLDLTSEPFNVYITGIDMWNSEKGYDLERSDVNMIVTVNPQTRKILLTSIPRDTYVMLHTAQEMDKLTHTGIYGVEETINTVQDWLGFDMNYYVKVNFTSVAKIIYTIGGVDVESPIAFKSSISKYKYKKGMNHMDGRQALFFARERKAFEGKDSLRVENQQKVMKAALNKMMTSSVLLTKYTDILENCAEDLETDMSIADMQSLIKMQLSDLSEWDIQSQKVEGDYAMDYVASMAQTSQYQVYKPRDLSVRDVKNGISMIMNPTEEEIVAAQEARKKSYFRGIIKKITGGDEAGEDAAEE